MHTMTRKYSARQLALAIALSFISAGAIAVALVPSVANASSPQAQTVYYSDAELDRLLAPVALYPDSLLTHILIASTYPLEVVQAERWAAKNKHLKPQEAIQRAANEPWDESVIALVGTPDVLKQMSDDLEWTQAVGEAFLGQQEAVLERVQVLRNHAYEAGNLKSNDYVNVDRSQRTIVIENVRREVVYVPYYDTRVVYGSWWWRHHQPVYWARPSLTVSIGSGIYWGVSYHVPSHFYFSHFFWPQRYVVINKHYHKAPPKKRHDYYMTKHDGQRWYHNPNHRRGVIYRHRDLQPERPKYYMVNGEQAVRPVVSARSMPTQSVSTRQVSPRQAATPQPAQQRPNRAIVERRLTQQAIRQPEVRQPDVRQPVVRQPEIRRAETRQPAVRQPEIRRPEVRQPATRPPEARQPVMSRPAVQQPQARQPQARQPQVTQPVQRSAPAATKPAVTQPAVTKPARTQNNSAPARRSGGNTRDF